MGTHGLAHLLPDWAVAWSAIAAVACLIMGAKRWAAAIAMVPIGRWILWPIFTQFFPGLPVWVQLLFGLVGALLIVHGFTSLIFGRETAGQVTGTLIVRIGEFLLFAPFRLIKSTWRFLRRK